MNYLKEIYLNQSLRWKKLKWNKLQNLEIKQSVLNLQLHGMLQDSIIPQDIPSLIEVKKIFFLIQNYTYCIMRAQLFTELKTDLYQDRFGFILKWCLNGIFPWRKYVLCLGFGKLTKKKRFVCVTHVPMILWINSFKEIFHLGTC